MIWDVPLVPQIDHRAASTATTITHAAELEGAPHAPRVTVWLDHEPASPNGLEDAGLYVRTMWKRDLVRCRRGGHQVLGG